MVIGTIKFKFNSSPLLLLSLSPSISLPSSLSLSLSLSPCFRFIVPALLYESGIWRRCVHGYRGTLTSLRESEKGSFFLFLFLLASLFLSLFSLFLSLLPSYFFSSSSRLRILLLFFLSPLLLVLLLPLSFLQFIFPFSSFLFLLTITSRAVNSLYSANGCCFVMSSHRMTPKEYTSD